MKNDVETLTIRDTNHFNDTNGIFEVKKPSDAKEEDGQ